MKKILTLLTLTLMITTTTTGNAFTASKVDQQKDINKGTVTQIVTKKTAEDADYDAKAAELTNRYLNNIRTCEPFHYSQYMDIFGLKLDLKIDINGWVNNKCNYALTGKIGGLGKDIREVFEINIKDEMLSKFEPKIECNFTKNDLNTIVAAIMARNEKNEVLVSQMLESPEKKYTKSKKTDITPEEEQLISLLTGGQACQILNKDDLIKSFTELMNLEDL